jgi:hypothetical protein
MQNAFHPFAKTGIVIVRFDLLVGLLDYLISFILW